MDPTHAVIWIFLGIFVLTALIALGALLHWVQLEPYYKKNLFRLLILEVVGCVVGFGTQAIRSIGSPRTDLRSVLLSRNLGWDWQYAEKGWRSRIHFKAAEAGKLEMLGNTYLVGCNAKAEGQRQAVLITWESSEPFEVPPKAETVTFRARRIYTEAAAKADPELQWEVGKKTDVQITVQLEAGLSGAIRTATSADTWGLVMTPAFP
jgi:hypothetical protein